MLPGEAVVAFNRHYQPIMEREPGGPPLAIVGEARGEYVPGILGTHYLYDDGHREPEKLRRAEAGWQALCWPYGVALRHGAVHPLR